MKVFEHIITKPSYEPSASDGGLCWWIKVAYISPTKPSEFIITVIGGVTKDEAEQKMREFVARRLTFPDEEAYNV